MEQKGVECPQRRDQIAASASVCGALSWNGAGRRAGRPGGRPRAAHRCAPGRAAPAFAAWRRADRVRRNSASGNSPPHAASSARMACCFAVSAGSRASGISTANRSIRRASRSTAAVSRAIHFLRTRPASTGSVAAVAVRKRGDFDRLARGQPRKHAVLQVLLFRGKFPFALRASGIAGGFKGCEKTQPGGKIRSGGNIRSGGRRGFQPPHKAGGIVVGFSPGGRLFGKLHGCPRACPELVEGSRFRDLGVRQVSLQAAGQHVAAQVGDAVVDGAPHLGHQRQHAAQHLAQRGQVVLRHPLGQGQQMAAQQGFLVQHRLQVTDLKLRRRFDVERRHHPDQLLVAEGGDHPRAPLRKLPLAHRVGKGAVQRHRQRDFAVGGHGMQHQCSGINLQIRASTAALFNTRANRFRMALFQLE